ncbi:hypothetical protein LTR62_008516 [Meristemomyces frigidus]|uniref:Vacuolar protein sorting-associated protein 54 n=1 Tax=Meristemomyces frigidus TaxID=1508187 RepID=A0AAN7TGT0_9PEZI|nr:hypothetical protein LTR62_008516 [Meristemomyces frigidus]
MSTPPPNDRFSIDTALSTPTSPTATRKAYPFPSTLDRQAAKHRYATRRGSNASVSSVGGSLDMHSSRRNSNSSNSSVRETSHNAISTLLHPPITRTGLVAHTQPPAGYKAPTARDIPPVTLTNIPHVPPENFRHYLTRIGPLFDSFQRGRLEADQAGWLKKDQDKALEQTDRFAEALERRFGKEGVPTSPKLSRTASTTTLSPTAESPIGTPGLPKRRSSAQWRRNRNEPTPLSTIPTVYFDEIFHLENPRTFDVVSERAEVVRPAPGSEANGATVMPRKPITTNAILQEKLSWYMDTVEVHLISSISTASSGFFAALGSLKELQTEAEESVAKIQGLRADLRRLDEEVAVRGLEVASKRRRKANVGKLAKAARQVERVVEEVKRADELVEHGEYEHAADQMDRVGRLVCGQAEHGTAGEDEDLMDLRPVKALQGLDSGLQELQLRIGAGFAQRFVSILIDDLREHVEKVPSIDTLKRWSRQRGIQPTYLESTPQFRSDLMGALNGLQRAGHMAPATTAYRDAVQKEVKALIRRYLPASTDDDADSMVSTSTRGGGKLSQQEKSSILARNLRALEPEDAEKLLVKVYTAVGEALRRVSTQTKVLLDVTSSMNGPVSIPKSPGLPPKSPSLPYIDDRLINGVSNKPATPSTQIGDIQEELSQALDMSSLLGQAVDAAQAQITKVLKVRNEQSTRLSIERFLRYFTINRLFADECEAVSGRGGAVLKGIINAQISGFVQVLGQMEGERIAGRLDGEEWNARDFSAQDDVVLGRVLGSMGKDPVEWGEAIRPVWEEVETVHRPGDEDAGAAPVANGSIVPPTSNGTQRPPLPPSAPTTTNAKATAKPAYIDSTRYILVPSATALLPTLERFLSLTSHLPSMTPSIATALLDCLRIFNSRSSQLILGAGATRVAGLKNITTKHLALSSQALSFVVALTPYMRECVRRHLPPGGASSGGAGVGGNILAEFDKTKRAYQDHQASIHDKLVEIMTSRSAVHVKTMHATYAALTSSSVGSQGKKKEEEQDDDDDRAKPSPYIETLTKETSTLHRVLSRHLHAHELESVMRRIFDAYTAQWVEAFSRVVGMESEGAGGNGSAIRQKLERDAEVLALRLGKVERGEGVGRAVLGVIKGKGGKAGLNGKVG